jgi:putative ABC transport system permease protein
MVRTEGIVTAAIGTVIGIAVGVLIAWVISHALTGQGLSFSIPWLRLVLLLGVGLVAGVLAGLLPAARAARIDVLAAIADE